MRKVKSQPNISCSATINSPYVQTVVDSVIISKVPINQSLSCIASHKFPDDLLNPSQDFISCLMSPPDTAQKKEINQEEILEPYEWERRMRLRKQRQNRASSS